ncbi:MAG: hypothetical protein H6714_02660 [Myxococcales bacterium]|nr:hypothetical protein [Myxococcales bacterium]
MNHAHFSQYPAQDYARERETLKASIQAFMEQCADGSTADITRDALLERVLSWQYTHVKPYQRFVDAQSLQSSAKDRRWPALPADIFRHARVSGHAPQWDRKHFLTSATTDHTQGQHFLRETTLYDQAAFLAARYALFPDDVSLPLLILAPSEEDAPRSSLSYMLARFLAWFPHKDSTYIWQNNHLDIRLLSQRLDSACHCRQPVALLGTALAFAHALKSLETTWRLPLHSRVMLTGGFKGKVHDVSFQDLRQSIATTFAIPEDFIVGEYGMTEVSSQLYTLNLRNASLDLPIRREDYWAPGWTRVSVVLPETGCPAPPGEVGIIRIDDLANLDSVASIQTSDLGVLSTHGLTLLGRAQHAGMRGCSWTADAQLSARNS